VSSVQAQLRTIHDNLKAELPEIGRIAVAIYDTHTDQLKTFVHSTDGVTPFSHYEAKLQAVPSLAELARTHAERVVSDLQQVPGADSGHNRMLLESGYRSSYTVPFYDRGDLYGFLFFDSQRENYFSATVVRHLSVYAHLISLMIIHALAPAGVLRSVVDMAREISHFRDEETGAHLDRMARYSRLIAKTLADQDPADEIDDEFVEFVFLFAPLHDVGKIAIPDHILLKPGRLTREEFDIMKTHVAKGVAIVDRIAQNFGVGPAQHVDLMRNIVRFHHESFDGSGYLEHRRGEDIPLEARVVTVADVFDALTTTRPYKPAWSNDDAFALLEDRAGRAFDPACVAALTRCREAVETIQRRFRAANGFHEAYAEDI
jgi:HD-GYP domain-containing protein (c-di-GMP phosphodiesterase class II)